MDKNKIAAFKKAVDQAPQIAEGQEITSELKNIIDEVNQKAEFDNSSEENLSLLLILGISLTKAGNLKEAVKYLENGCKMIQDPKQDRLKKEFILSLINLGE